MKGKNEIFFVNIFIRISLSIESVLEFSFFFFFRESSIRKINREHNGDDFKTVLINSLFSIILRGALFKYSYVIVSRMREMKFLGVNSVALRQRV